MQVIVVGAGRSGTNWALEVVRCSGKFDFTEKVQDNDIFNHEKLPAKYGTKIPTEHRQFNLRNLKRLMNRNKGLKVLFTIRHPVDMALSKIYRGQPAELGGDLPGRSPDANLGGALYAVEFMYLMWKHMCRRWSDRMLTVKLEDLILVPETPVRAICEFLDIKEQLSMFQAYKFIRVPYKHQRYHYEIDKSQVGLHKRWETIYGGFFKTRKTEVMTLLRELNYVMKGLGYA